MNTRISMADLGSLHRLASGGQGVVFDAPGLRMPYASSLVFKQYKPEVARSLDVPVLESMPAYLESLPFAEGIELLSIAAWPCRLVEDRGAVTGFVMPMIPETFFLQMKKSSGISREAAEFQHLLNDEGFLARRGIEVSDQDRYELLRAVVLALSVFHRHGIAVGDLSPKNLLFARRPAPGVYFIDCDAMRFQGRSVIHQVETPGWEVHAVSPAEELGTPASDAYKLALLALRLLTGTQDARDPGRLPPTVPTAIRQLIQAALSADCVRRPKPADWVAPLGAAAMTASTHSAQATAQSNQSPQAIRTAAKAPLKATPQLRQSPAPAPARPAGGRRQSRRRVFLMVAGILAFVAAAGGGTFLAITLHNLSVPRPTATLYDPGSSADVNSVAFNSDGNVLAVGDSNGTTYLWNISSQKILNTLSEPGGAGVQAVAFSPNSELIVTGDGDGKGYLWGMPSMHREIAIKDPTGGNNGIRAAAFSPNGRTVATGDYSGHTYVWDASNAREIARLAYPAPYSGITAVAFSPDGKLLASGDEADSSTYLWDIATGHPGATIHDPGGDSGVTALAFSPDGKMLASADLNDAVYLWDLSTDRIMAKFATDCSEQSVSFSASGEVLAAGDGCGDIHIWNVLSGKVIAVLHDPHTSTNGVQALAFSPNGTTLASGDANGSTYLWDMRKLANFPATATRASS